MVFVAVIVVFFVVFVVFVAVAVVFFVILWFFLLRLLLWCFL